MGGVVTVMNNLNFAMNMALCVTLSYYEANNITPQTSSFKWDKVGYVWFTVIIVPWYSTDNEFAMGEYCLSRYNNYRVEAAKAATDVAKYGEGKLGHLRIIGKNLTKEEAEDRLVNMAYVGNGFKVADKTLTVYGGPSASAIGYKVIDISDHFDPVDFYMTDKKNP